MLKQIGFLGGSASEQGYIVRRGHRVRLVRGCRKQLDGGLHVRSTIDRQSSNVFVACVDNPDITRSV